MVTAVGGHIIGGMSRIPLSQSSTREGVGGGAAVPSMGLGGMTLLKPWLTEGRARVIAMSWLASRAGDLAGLEKPLLMGSCPAFEAAAGGAVFRGSAGVGKDSINSDLVGEARAGPGLRVGETRASCSRCVVLDAGGRRAERKGIRDRFVFAGVEPGVEGLVEDFSISFAASWNI